MSFSRTWAGGMLLLAAGGLAQAQGPAQLAASRSAPVSTESLHLRSLAAQCAQCHGTEGRAAPGSEVPGLAGMPTAYLTEQMKAFRGGTRTSTVMQQLAKGFSDTQIDQLARYFAAQNAAQGAGPGAAVAKP